MAGLVHRLLSAAARLTAPPPAPAAAAARRYREAAGRTIDGDEDQWRRLTGETNRDLLPISQARMRELAIYLWESNPLARAAIELPVAYLLAEGVTVTCGDPEAQGWLDAFWGDPINRLDVKLPKKVRELALYGEQCWPAFTNPVNGHVRLGYLDPALIETVVTDPDNAEQPIGIVTTRDRRGEARRYRVIVNGPETVFSRRTREIRAGFDDGEAFYVRVNDLSNGKRGRSDLLSNFDWLDGYDQFLFGTLEHAGFLRAFIWDVTLSGATQEEVEARARTIQPPRSGGVRVHNEAETWSAVAPEIRAADSSELARLMRNQVLGGAGLPEHWFGGGGDVNRATAGEMGDPTFKLLSMRQAVWRHVLEDLAAYQIRRRWQAATGLEPDLAEPGFAEYRPEASFPEMTARDTSRYAGALGQVVLAATAAIERGLLPEETGVRLIASVAGRLGVEIDAAETLSAARTEASARAEARAAADSFPDPPDDDAGDDEP